MIACHVLPLECHASFLVYCKPKQEDLSFEVGFASVEGSSALLAHHSEVIERFLGLFAVNQL